MKEEGKKNYNGKGANPSLMKEKVLLGKKTKTREIFLEWIANCRVLLLRVV